MIQVQRNPNFLREVLVKPCTKSDRDITAELDANKSLQLFGERHQLSISGVQQHNPTATFQLEC
jgi:hypothetical protein